MAKNVDGFKAKEINDYGYTPCDVIFNHVKRPDNYLMCKSVNVYDDRWRVNVYSKRYVEGIEGNTISASYFVKFNKENNALTIIS